MSLASYAGLSILPGMASRQDPPLVRALADGSSVMSVELRPPRTELSASAGMDAWIDTYHAVSGFVRARQYVFLTDSAVGASEENNLRHLVINLGSEVPRDRVVPFLTTKHSMQYCLSYAERAWQEGFSSLVVLGGDRSIGPPRCVSHAWQLREAIREQVPDLTLGGWANPHGDCASQVGHLLDEDANAEFYLTQVVSHHAVAGVERFLAEAARRNLETPGLFGLFFYRSANERTLTALNSYLPVPVEQLKREFAEGASPEEVCARSVRVLASAGVRHFYISNLPLGRAAVTLRKILSLASAAA